MKITGKQREQIAMDVLEEMVNLERNARDSMDEESYGDYYSKQEIIQRKKDSSNLIRTFINVRKFFYKYDLKDIEVKTSKGITELTKDDKPSLCDTCTNCVEAEFCTMLEDSSTGDCMNIRKRNIIECEWYEERCCFLSGEKINIKRKVKK